MNERLEQIGELLRAELAERAELDDTDVVVQWTAVVGLLGADDDGDVPSTVAVQSDPGMAVRHELGLLEERRMLIQAVIADAVRRARDEETD